MKKKEYDYYIYIDYSEKWIGYCIDNLLNIKRRENE